ncbi:MAG: hypothetical protein RSA01_09920 [Clostridium sp.]|uniref:hypothetical protein n=1 Tax=Clostridium sp. TaxID=1506 RepID=UPI002FC77543
MRFIKFLVVILIVLGAAGYGVYHFGTKVASDKLVNTMYNELEKSGDIKKVKKAVESDPELKSFVEGASNVDGSKLPFTTKEEATKVLIKKVGLTKLNDIRVGLQEGTMSKAYVLNEVQSKFSEDEIKALQVIVYKELNK